MVDKISSTGAEVVIYGNQWAESDEYLRNFVMKSADSTTLAVYCHPFDNPVIWEGHATMIDEIATQLPDQNSLKGVVCSVGGGGLYNGIVTGLKRNKLSTLPVLAIETEPAACLAASLEAGKVVKLESVNTIAKSLAAQFVSEQAFVFANGGHPTKSLVISDAQAVNSTVKFAEDHGITVEPACGAALAVVYENLWDKYLPNLTKSDCVVIIVCGGSATSLDDLIMLRNSL
ncbi:tryptophan synthase beta subunit-like PLP-dependent enzyme [Nadsonia fulvescens var. elongata DSM 6958]|uniref:L-serine ammonia-lyase n=1 Tax=Nadsonia fulvescens var. elongata DSM 6958 TaxID=857566 RepID=A0A1E3PJA9_9ASCO|nr:tryptophan synthase beta subunit-like PLP-dependent enzyme [Nadsonia fulvescens var. elongata DSM 6958]